MKKIEEFRASALMGVTAALIILGYELQGSSFALDGVSPIVVALAVFFLGAFAARFLVDSILRLQFIRAIIQGSHFAEGFWHLKTKADDSGSALSYDGVLQITYDARDRQTQVTTYRIDSDGSIFTTSSLIASISEFGSRLRYLNFFYLNYPAGEGRYGLSAGDIYCSDSHSRLPDLLDSRINVTGEPIIRSQRAIKITDREIKKYRAIARKNNSRLWQIEFLQRHRN
ncbi:MAG: hypothetical protein AAGM38_17380 [Pseudomonadota bacterium]